MPQTFSVCLNQPATHVDVEPGGEIILKGSFYSKHDGSTIDAATTSWPQGAPGGASIDSGGLLDLAGGGFRLTSQNPNTHEVHAIATGDPAPACGDFNVAAPCLPLRLLPKARSNLMTVDQFSESLIGGSPKGCFTMEVPSAVVVVPPKAIPVMQVVGSALGIAAAAGLAWVLYRRQAASPAGQLRALAKRVRMKLRTADSVLAAPLAPAIESALRAIAERRVDASSKEGKRVMDVLLRVDKQIDGVAEEARAEREQEAADELVREVETALEAAAEAQMIGGRAAK